MWVDRPLKPIERLVFRLSGVREHVEMHWKTYAIAMSAFNAFGLLVLYAIQRLQGFLPLNPAGFDGVNPNLAFNTASSFTSNTNW